MGVFLGYATSDGDELAPDGDESPTRFMQRSVLAAGESLIELERPIASAHDVLPPSGGARGWGPREVPPELQKTTFWERSVLVGDREPEAVAAAPSARPPVPSAPVRTLDVPPRGARRGVIYASLCGAFGVLLGTAVGLAASREPIAPSIVVPTAPTSTPAASVEATPLAPAAAIAAPAAVAPPAPAATPSVAAAGPAVPAPESAEELLAQARAALRDGDAEPAEALLVRARAAGAPARDADRIHAELAVLRGDGAPAVPRLRALAERHDRAPFWVALGRVLEHAERDPEAAQAYQAALAIDPQDVDAHVGLASIEARDADLGAAQRHLRIAEEASRAIDERDPQRDARLRVTAGLIELERGRLAEATEEATRARVLDARSAEAALLLARIALARRQDALPHLRAAIVGRAPAPLALGLLAPRVRGEEACELAVRYLERAPEGWDARAMRRIESRCL